MEEHRLYGTTETDGSLTVKGDAVSGKVYAIAWIDGTFADNVTAVISTIENEAATTLLTLAAGEGDDDVVYYPRALACDAGATALTGTAGGDRVRPIAVGKLQLVVAAGGSAKEGGCIVYIEEE